MPVLARFGSTTIEMYLRDHAPPHFHIVDPDFDVMVRISDLQIIAGRARKAQLAGALAWAEAHKSDLAARWAEMSDARR